MEICQDYLFSGKCKYGSKCRYLHSTGDAAKAAVETSKKSTPISPTRNKKDKLKEKKGKGAVSNEMESIFASTPSPKTPKENQKSPARRNATKSTVQVKTQNASASAEQPKEVVPQIEHTGSTMNTPMVQPPSSSPPESQGVVLHLTPKSSLAGPSRENLLSVSERREEPGLPLQPRYGEETEREPHAMLQIVPITPSITVTPVVCTPSCEVEVNVIVEESALKKDDWLGLFKLHQYQSSRAITQKQASKLHYQRMLSNNTRYRKLSCRFYAPKHAGAYVFRYFHSGESYSVLDSNDITVIIRGRDFADSVAFVRQKLDDAGALLFNIRSLSSTLRFLQSTEGWEQPGELSQVLDRLVAPLLQETTPESYTAQVQSDLHVLLELVARRGDIVRELEEKTRRMVLQLLRSYCHICCKFYRDFEPFRDHMQTAHRLTRFAFTPCGPPMLIEFTKQIVYDFRAICPQAAFYATRDDLIRRLTEGLRAHTPYSECSICIYGSSNNGFGTDSSDIDLCLLENAIKKEEVLEIAPRLGEALQATGMREVDYSRLHARIPVVRFEDPISQLQCDLCVNNVLPIRNTFLLKMYSCIDARVKILGIILKKWAKVNNLNDPIFKTLSSYGYILMLIHFLQSAVSPPVLPILQLLPPSWSGDAIPATRLPAVPTPSYDGTVYDTYFYNTRDLSLLNRYAARNKMMLGDLLLRFFYYYGYSFDYLHSVVTVRQLGTIDKEEKCSDCLWRQLNQLSIEDPFEVDYDVAHVISPGSSSVIQESFARAYNKLMDLEPTISDNPSVDLMQQIYEL